ncbi:MAG: M3 family metallopeptidase, partial [Planctomycetota bacterium]|nr:M3 family metallopeptidase [Planctomycetota bacterium]
MIRIFVFLTLFVASDVLADRSIPSSPAALLERVENAFAAADDEVAEIIAIENDKRTYENTIGALDDMMARLDAATNFAVFMAYVHPDAGIREAAQSGEQLWSDWSIDYASNEDLYEAVKAYAETKPNLQGEQARYLEHMMRDYRRAGMSLSAEDRTRLNEIKKEIGSLSIEFESNIRSDETVIPMTLEELDGVPQDTINSLKKINGIYLVSLDYPTFGPIMDYCNNSITRQKVWMSYSRRAGMKNVRVLEKIIKLRDAASDILGYDTTADYETEVRMAKNDETVAAFYDKLQPLVRKKAERDWEELLFAKRSDLVFAKQIDLGEEPIDFYHWDFSYYFEKIKKAKYAVDSKLVQEYLSLENVMGGLFEITQHLYGIEYREVTDRAEQRGASLWHEDVRLFEVWDTQTDENLGEFYLDLHPRDQKYSHAAQWGLAQHKIWSDGTKQKPVAALVCNFTKPTAEKPSLLTHGETETFFHEFGHCLHTILSTVETASYAGTSVERDFVEAPSQMFEEWVWTPETLSLFAKHYKTNDPMPEDLISGMIAARNLQSGMLAESQIFLGKIDQAYHTDRDGEVDTTQVAYDIYDESRLYTHTPETWYQSSFGHLTGYQAGYYGYMWSLVYAQDMFQRFKELGMLNPEAGAYYRDKILSRGGTLDGLDLVRGYLGREPSMDPFLDSLGLNDPIPQAVSLPGTPVYGDATRLLSGLEFWSIEEGEGVRPLSQTDQVVIHYTGWLEDGTELGSSYGAGTPAIVRLNSVMPGWTEAISDMRVGDKRKLRIPSDLGFGSVANGSIPADSILVFDIELLDLNPYEKYA